VTFPLPTLGLLALLGVGGGCRGTRVTCVAPENRPTAKPAESTRADGRVFVSKTDGRDIWTGMQIGAALAASGVPYFSLDVLGDRWVSVLAADELSARRVLSALPHLTGRGNVRHPPIPRTLLFSGSSSATADWKAVLADFPIVARVIVEAKSRGMIEGVDPRPLTCEMEVRPVHVPERPGYAIEGVINFGKVVLWFQAYGAVLWLERT
jgi:hypothetical protein